MGVGAVLALLAHGALVVALTSTVQWRTSPPEVFSAELWAAVPQAAAPLPAPPPPPVAAAPVAPPPLAAKPETAAKPTPPPPPVVREADIATEQARQLETQRKAQQAVAEAEKAKAKAKADAESKALEAERAKAEATRKREAETKKAEEAKLKDDKLKEEKTKRDEAERKAAAEAKAEARAEDERLVKQREENLRRIMGQAGTANPATTGTGGAGSAAQSAAPSASYVGRLIGMIKPNIVFTGQVEGNPSAEVEVRAAAGGSIISKRLVKSSGNKDWDEAVLRAMDRTATLPSDNGRVPPTLILVFRPKD